MSTFGFLFTTICLVISCWSLLIAICNSFGNCSVNIAYDYQHFYIKKQLSFDNPINHSKWNCFWYNLKTFRIFHHSKPFIILKITGNTVQLVLFPSLSINRFENYCVRFHKKDVWLNFLRFADKFSFAVCASLYLNVDYCNFFICGSLQTQQTNFDEKFGIRRVLNGFDFKGSNTFITVLFFTFHISKFYYFGLLFFSYLLN